MNIAYASAKRKHYTVNWTIVTFFALAYAMAWGAFGIIAIIAHQSGLDSPQELMAIGETWQYGDTIVSAPHWFIYLLTRLADFSFSIAGIILIIVTTGWGGLLQLWQRLTHWCIHPIWYVLGLLPLVLYAVATMTANAGSSASISVNTISTILFSLHSGFFVSLFLRGAFGEEFGLRGFALPRLQETMSPFRASLIIGALWSTWHLPVLIGRDVVSIVAFILLSLGLSFIFTWMFNGSGGSLIPVLLFHATQNWEEGFETISPTLIGTDWELVSTLALLLLGIVAGIAVWRSSTQIAKQGMHDGSKIMLHDEYIGSEVHT